MKRSRVRTPLCRLDSFDYDSLGVACPRCNARAGKLCWAGPKPAVGKRPTRLAPHVPRLPEYISRVRDVVRQVKTARDTLRANTGGWK